MKIPIALEVEIPEETYVSLSSFLEEHSQWDFHQVFTVAVSHFLADQKVRTKMQSHKGGGSEATFSRSQSHERIRFLADQFEF